MIPPQQKSASSSMEDLGKQIKSGIDKVRQYAAEKMGRSESTDQTPMPEDFARLEGKMEAVRGLFDGLTRCTRQMLGADEYSPPIGDQFKAALDKLQESAKRVGEGEGLGLTKKDEMVLIQDATADYCVQGACVLRDLPNTAPSDAFEKYGGSMRKVASARRQMASDVNRLFIEPFGTYAGAYDNAMKACKAAHAARLELDTNRSKQKVAEEVPKKAVDGDGVTGEIKKEAAGKASAELTGTREAVDASEAKFKAACAEAVQEMEAFVQYTEATHCLDALAKAQRDYHAAAAAAL